MGKRRNKIMVEVTAVTEIEVDDVLIKKGDSFKAELIQYVGFEVSPKKLPTIFVMLAVDEINGKRHDGLVVPVSRRSVKIRVVN